MSPEQFTKASLKKFNKLLELKNSNNIEAEYLYGSTSYNTSYNIGLFKFTIYIKNKNDQNQHGFSPAAKSNIRIQAYGRDMYIFDTVFTLYNPTNGVVLALKNYDQVEVEEDIFHMSLIVPDFDDKITLGLILACKELFSKLDEYNKGA